jgi:hypothetical protein
LYRCTSPSHSHLLDLSCIIKVTFSMLSHLFHLVWFVYFVKRILYEGTMTNQSDVGFCMHRTNEPLSSIHRWSGRLRWKEADAYHTIMTRCVPHTTSNISSSSLPHISIDHHDFHRLISPTPPWKLAHIARQPAFNLTIRTWHPSYTIAAVPCLPRL